MATYNLTAVAINQRPPTIMGPVFSKGPIRDFKAAGLTTESPQITMTGMDVTYIFTAAPLSVGAVVLGTPRSRYGMSSLLSHSRLLIAAGVKIKQKKDDDEET